MNSDDNTLKIAKERDEIKVKMVEKLKALNFNDDEISSSIYNILYDFIEEGIEKYYYNELPFEEVKNRSKFTKEAIKEMDYEKFEKLVQEKIF